MKIQKDYFESLFNPKKTTSMIESFDEMDVEDNFQEKIDHFNASLKNSSFHSFQNDIRKDMVKKSMEENKVFVFLKNIKVKYYRLKVTMIK